MDDFSQFNPGPYSSSDRKAKRPAQYTPQACNFCQKRHIKCDSQNPCFQCSRRGIKCDYKQQIMKRGPKPGALRDLKPRTTTNQVNKLIAEVDKQRQLAEYWRRNYLMLQQLAQEQGISLPKLVLSTAGSKEQLGDQLELPEQSSAATATLKSPIAYDAVAAFMQCVYLALPNYFQFNQDRVYEWWLLLSNPELPERRLPVDKLADGLVHACVFAHGCRLRSSEDRAQYFGDRAEVLLKEIFAGDNGAAVTTSAEFSNQVLSAILLHISFQGALPNAELIQSALERCVQIIDTFSAKASSSEAPMETDAPAEQNGHERKPALLQDTLDPIVVQRVYAQMVGTQQSQEGRWKYLDLALQVDVPVAEDELLRRSFYLSNMAIIALVFCNSVNWFEADEQEKRMNHINKVLAYLDSLETALSKFEIRARPEGPRVFSDALMAGYRIIVYSTRASIHTTLQNDNDAMMWFAKTIETAKLLRDCVQVPLLATALALLYAIRLLQSKNQTHLLSEGMSVLERIIKYYPALYMPWKLLSGQVASLLGTNAGGFGASGSSQARFDPTGGWTEDTHAASTASLLGIHTNSGSHHMEDYGMEDDESDDDGGDDDYGATDENSVAAATPSLASFNSTPQNDPSSSPSTRMKGINYNARKNAPSSYGGPMRGGAAGTMAPSPVSLPARSSPTPRANSAQMQQMHQQPPPLTPQQQQQIQQQQQAAAAAMMRYNMALAGPTYFGFNPAMAAAVAAGAQGADPATAAFLSPAAMFGPSGQPGGAPQAMFMPPQAMMPPHMYGDFAALLAAQAQAQAQQVQNQHTMGANPAAPMAAHAQAGQNS